MHIWPPSACKLSNPKQSPCKEMKSKCEHSCNKRQVLCLSLVDFVCQDFLGEECSFIMCHDPQRLILYDKYYQNLKGLIEVCQVIECI